MEEGIAARIQKQGGSVACAVLARWAGSARTRPKAVRLLVHLPQLRHTRGHQGRRKALVRWGHQQHSSWGYVGVFWSCRHASSDADPRTQLIRFGACVGGCACVRTPHNTDCGVCSSSCRAAAPALATHACVPNQSAHACTHARSRTREAVAVQRNLQPGDVVIDGQGLRGIGGGVGKGRAPKGAGPVPQKATGGPPMEGAQVRTHAPTTLGKCCTTPDCRALRLEGSMACCACCRALAGAAAGLMGVPPAAAATWDAGL